MKLRELKEWIDTKDDSELDENVCISDRMWAKDERDIYEIVRADYQLTDGFKGYVLLVMSKQLINVLEEKDELNKKLEKISGDDYDKME